MSKTETKEVRRQESEATHFGLRISECGLKGTAEAQRKTHKGMSSQKLQI